MRQIAVGPLYSLAVTLVTLGNYYGRTHCFEPCRGWLYFGPFQWQVLPGTWYSRGLRRGRLAPAWGFSHDCSDTGCIFVVREQTQAVNATDYTAGCLGS